MRDHSLLDKVLEPGGLSARFQPIFEVRQQSVGLHSLECLSTGPKGTNLEKADVLFEYARKKRCESVLDRACVELALQSISELPATPNFSVNVHAATLESDPDFIDFLQRTAEHAEISIERLVVEIVEHAPVWCSPRFFTSISQLRSCGVKIALDDIGNGQSNYRMILDCCPDYFKIDRHFVKGVHSNLYRQAICESVKILAQKTGAEVIAEGLEDSADLDALTLMRIELFQGYLFLPPLPMSELKNGELFGGHLISALFKLGSKYKGSKCYEDLKVNNRNGFDVADDELSRTGRKSY